MPDPALLPDALRRRLDSLILTPRQLRMGSMKGERRSVKRGTSIEFADYRDYVPGDDLRKLDWNVYARLDRPVIKLLEDEEDLAVTCLIDTSASMNWPLETPSPSNGEDGGGVQHKLTYALQLAAALGYVALRGHDRLALTALGGAAQPYGPTRGQAQIVPLLRYLHSLQGAGPTDLNATLRSFALRERRAGLVFVITDLFSPTGYVEGLNMLRAKGHEIVLLHVLCPDEINPPHTGDLRLVDVETGQAREITLDASLHSLYRQRLETWLDEVRDTCLKRQIAYLMISTETPLDKVIFSDLRRLQLVK